MMKFQLQNESNYAFQKGAHILFFHDGQTTDAPHLDNIKSVCPQIDEFLASRTFKGNEGECIVIPLLQHIGTYLICMGMKHKNNASSSYIELYRRTVARAVKTAASLGVSSVTLYLSHLKEQGKGMNIEESYLIKQTVIFSTMAEYHFDEYLTDQDRKEHRIADCWIVVDDVVNVDAMYDMMRAGTIIGKAVNKTRHWIDTPPLHATPLFLSEKAKTIASEQNLKINVFSEQEVVAMGMGGLEAVSRGSDVDCQLVVMEYRAANAHAPTIALVGKGITFDSGGLSLKPAASMETMKDDMAGAAAVICVMEALAQLHPAVNVIGIAPLSENLPSGKATKPGDIIRFYNGKTAEVKNTDAEGRLILADALSYAVKHYKPDAIIDIATLTGACAYALGPFFTGLMSEHDELVQKIERAAQRSGDYVWRLPMSNDYKKAIKSEVADICNIGDGRIKAGAITAAHFLQHFVGDTPWAHLDIAGTAFDVPHVPYFRSGATGAGVRLFIELIMNW